MANPDQRFGLRPVRHISGAPWNGATIRCYVSASYATALYIGDPVDLYGGATLSNRITAARVPPVMLSAMTDGTYVVGVIVSFEPDPTNPELQYRKASTLRYCNVCCDPFTIYQIRDDGGAALGKVTIGQNAVGIATHSGDTATGLSGLELDAGTTTAPSANSSNTMIIVGCADIPDNAWDGSTDTHVVWDVLLCNHRFFTLSASGALGVTAT
jgi:hypothetical protein